MHTQALHNASSRCIIGSSTGSRHRPREPAIVTITRTDIETQVAAALEGSSPESDSVDQAAVVTESVDNYGLIDTETIEHDVFWAIVARHDSAL